MTLLRTSLIPFGFLLVLAVFFIVFALERNPFALEEGSTASTLVTWIPFILKGFAFNIVMSIVGMAIATALGALVGFTLISSRSYIRTPGRWFMQLFRNSPWLVILFVMMMALPYNMHLPFIGSFQIPDWVKASFALSLPVAANLGETMRGAIASVPRGQWESAASLALPKRDILFMVILPQCYRRMIPPWMNWYALLTLSTPITALLGVEEALSNTKAAMESAGSRPALVLPFYFFLLCLFFVIIYPISVWTRRLERKFLAAS